jgi:glycosyltransferase involved in cell wall biosynthesis
MKIVFGKTSFAGPISGADEIAVMYAIELKRAGHDTGVLLVHPPASDDSLAARLRAADVPLTTLASPAFSASLAAGRKLAIRAMRTFTPASRLIRSKSRTLVHDIMQRYHASCCNFLTCERPDVLHVLTPDPGAMMLIRAAHASGVPVVYQEAGLPYHPPGFEEVYERFVSVLPLCRKVAVLSPRLVNETSQALPQIAPPTVLPLMSHDMTNGANHAAATAPAVRFGFAARLEYLKGPLQLVEAFRAAHKVQPDIALRIAGEGSQRQEIVNALQQHGLDAKCQFTGVYSTVKERGQFMQSIDVFVLPSLTEGTPNAIIEAMAHGKPVIATTVGGIPDLVDQTNGILVPPGDPQCLADAVTLLAHDGELRRRMGHAARETYERLFTPRVVLPLLVDFYEQLMNGGSAAHNGNRRRTGSDHPWSQFND